jgi:hypothetical protein
MQRGLVSNLERVGKGWFNIHETNHQTYMYSKLRRLLNMVRFHSSSTEIVWSSKLKHAAVLSWRPSSRIQRVSLEEPEASHEACKLYRSLCY